MKKVTVALALMMSIGLTGCANTDIFSGDVYTADQAKEARSISYGTIVSVRPVKIQADNPGVIGTVGGGAGSTDILISWIYRLTTGAAPQYSMAAAVTLIISLIVISISMIAFKKLHAFDMKDV